uniref:Uncharacterized protein n=1 Tax=Arundo donax TaxID=35708 RepID=A0A0A9DEM2_ARUDO
MQTNETNILRFNESPTNPMLVSRWRSKNWSGSSRGSSHPDDGLHRQRSRARPLALPFAMQFHPLKISLQVWS